MYQTYWIYILATRKCRGSLAVDIVSSIRSQILTGAVYFLITIDANARMKKTILFSNVTSFAYCVALYPSHATLEASETHFRAPKIIWNEGHGFISPDLAVPVPLVDFSYLEGCESNGL